MYKYVHFRKENCTNMYILYIEKKNMYKYKDVIPQNMT